MNARIHLLDPLLANQIAAGEVIERPASVVKELVENSLDAQAKKIEILLEKGGTQRIVVRDDGSGVHKEDLLLALNRHATSKIYQPCDLESITSLGFRGEALASISSVSRLVLSSRVGDATHGWQVKADGRNANLTLDPVAHPQGTTLEVNDLFFNTPARRKFLRAENTEWGHVEEVVKRMALSAFSVGFSLTHNDRVIYQLRGATDDLTRHRRVAELCGKSFLEKSLVLDAQVQELTLSGWIGLPEVSRTRADLQYFYINGRMVRDKLVTHALKQAYQDMSPGRYPAFILFLELDPSEVDVNVHPTKHEVRFRQARLVHDFIYAQVVRALKKDRSPPVSFDFTQKRATFSPSGTLPLPQKEESSLGHSLGLLHHRYLLLENATGMNAVDLVSLKTHLLMQHFQETLQKGELQAQPFLLPLSVTLSEKQMRILELKETFFKRLGVDLQKIDVSTILVRKMPVRMQEENVKIFLEKCLSEETTSEAQGCILLAEAGATANEEWTSTEISQLLTALKSFPQKNKFLREFSLVEVGKWFPN